MTTILKTLARWATLAALLLNTALVARAANNHPPAASVARLPVKEVTVFKDGHAFVLQEGRLPTDGGNVVLDYLPTPVIGTFWAYSADKGAKLSGVVAGQRRAMIERTALSLRELIEANVGAEALVTETNQSRHVGSILGLPPPPRGAALQSFPGGPRNGTFPQGSSFLATLG